jgi:arginine exporter protein ArgO
MGVFLGSALWWLTLSGVVELLRHRVGAGLLRWVNRVAGVVIAGFGVYALGSLLW